MILVNHLHIFSCKQHNVTFLAARSSVSRCCLVCDVRLLTLNVAMTSTEETLFPICPRKCNIIKNVSITFANVEDAFADLMHSGCISIEDSFAVVDAAWVCFLSYLL